MNHLRTERQRLTDAATPNRRGRRARQAIMRLANPTIEQLDIAHSLLPRSNWSNKKFHGPIGSNKKVG